MLSLMAGNDRLECLSESCTGQDEALPNTPRQKVCIVGVVFVGAGAEPDSIINEAIQLHDVEFITD